MFKDAISKNWKTTTVGVIASASGYVAMFPTGFPDKVVNVCRYVNIGGLAAFGVVSKDFNEGGTND